MKRIILFFCMVVASTIFLNAQEVWENIKFPEKLNGEVTAIAVSNSEIYLGTAGDGIWYSDNLGTDWTHSYIDEMLKDSITHIVFSPTGSVFATGKSLIYKTTDKGREWIKIYEIIRQQELIHCISVSPLGKLAVGTDRSVFISDAGTDGMQLYKISTQLETFNTLSIIVDNNETVFVSGTHNLKLFELWRFNNSKQGWVQTENNIETNPIVSDFSMNEKFDLFAAIENSIYIMDYEKMVWEKYIEDKDDEIIRLKFEAKGNLITLGRKFVKLYKPGEKIGTIVEGLDASKLKDVIINGRGKVIGLGVSDIIISVGDLSDIIVWLISTNFSLRDANGSLLSNRTFKLYKANCDADQVYIKDVTTNASGVFSISLTSYSLAANDRIKVEKTTYKKANIKSGHSALDNQMYEIRLNNMKYDGLGVPSYYQITSSKDQTITLDNSVVYHNLLISVEWDAKRAFLDTLASWTRLMSDFLYDVADGQLIINKVAIYDNRQKWDQADIRFFASNQVWPNASVGGINLYDTEQAQVRMPRRWWGNGGDTRNMTSRNDWFTRNEDDNFMGTSSTMAHELGHYMLTFWDEYVYSDTNKAKLLPDGYNYGFMDYQYQNGNQWSSEFSSAVRYPNNNYKITAQWYYNNKDCWSQYETAYENTYTMDGATFWCPIKKPSERTLNAGYQYLLGPADHMTRQATCSVKNVTQVQIFDQNFGGGDFRFTAVDPDGNILGNANVMLSRTYGPVTITKPNQGNTPDNGQMLVLGAEVGDNVSVIYITKIYFPFIGYIDWPAFAVFPVTSITTFDKADNSKQLEEPRIELKPVKGTFEFMPNLQFGNGESVMFEAVSLKPFPSKTTADIQISIDTLIRDDLNFNSKQNLYSMPVNQIYKGDGNIFINATDSAGNAFSFPVLYSITSAKSNNFSNGGDAEISFDNAEKTIEQIAITTCRFPASRDGLAPNQEHVGAYFSFSTYPNQITLNDGAVLNIRYQPEELIKMPQESLKIFRWDEGRKKWSLIGGLVDTAIRIVSTLITEGGIYTLFTEDNATGLDDEGFNGYDLKVSPNPAERNCYISFVNPRENNVELKLYNSLGQEVRTIFAGTALYGANRFNLDVSSLEAGVYYVQLNDKKRVMTARLVVVR